MNLVIATNNKDLVTALSRQGNYNVLGSYSSRSELERELPDYFETPEVLLMTEGFDCQGSSVADVLVGIKQEFPSLRIVYIHGSEFTTGTKRILTKMVENGIYDIAIGDEPTLSSIINLLENPRSYGDASSILEADGNEVYENVITVSSLKPGTGKTFLVTNLAVALAKYGTKKRMRTGKFVDPRILLVDGDLLNLSVGTMLRTNNYDRNMLTALQRIAKYVNEDCHYTMSDSDVDSIKTYVRSCLCTYKDCPNLYIMGANSISLEDLSKIAPVHFYFMMQMLVKAFDIILVDSNSAFDHQTTAALYELSGHIYLMLDNDYNNIQNNLRYIDKLREMGYDNKITYIVNKDMSREMETLCLEDLVYDTSSIGDLVIDHRIPLIDAGKIKTIDYGESLVITSNIAPEARKAILDIADSIWKIDYDKTEVLEEDTKKPNKLIGLLNN